jgi:hypothetical protein
MKFVLVTGGIYQTEKIHISRVLSRLSYEGVISGIGKGIVSSSIGTILKGCGLRVTSIKIDPYINIDVNTLN